MVKAKECVMFNTRFPQVFARAVADHVEPYQVLHCLSLGRGLKTQNGSFR